MPTIEKRITDVCNRLQRARAKSGMSQTEVHAMTGVHPPNQSRLELKHNRNPSVDIVARLGEAYGLSLSELLGGRSYRGDWRKQFLKVISKLMQASKLSYRDVGTRAGLNYSAVYRILQGDRDPHLASLIKIADAFQVEPHELVSNHKR